MIGLFRVPHTWVWTTLDEIADIVGGVTKDSKKQSNPSLPMVPYLRVANVQRGYLDLENITEIRVPERTFEKLRLRPGDVLLNEGGDRDKIGRGWIWSGQIPDCIHQNHVFRARIRDGLVHPKFLAWFANECARDWFDRNATQSVNLASISLSKIRKLPVPVPPVAEQSLIVAALEGHLSHIAEGAAALSAVARRAERLRRRILLDLVESCSAGQWSEYRLSSVADSVRNGMFVSRPGVTPNGVPILRVGAVRSLSLGLSDLRYSGMSEAEVVERGYELRTGDLLFTRYNGNPDYVGACAVVPPGVGPLTYPDKLIRVRLNRDVAIPEFVAMACSTGMSRDAIRRAVKTTAGQAGISGREIKNLPLRVPSLQEQQRIVAVFGERDREVRRLENSITEAARKAEGLRRALISEAFAGRLVQP